ncbi:neurotrypsin-like isoform X2 [Littorina saxatilis]
MVNLGNGWTNLFGHRNDNAQQVAQITPPPPTPPNPRMELPIPYSGELIRLRAVRGFMNAGIVEVYRTGRWGLVCDDAWDIKDANVVCRHLGFRQGAQASPGEAYYGVPPGRWTSDDIIMDDVDCDGSETSLQRCVYEDSHDCTISEAASVVCRTNAGCPEDWIGSGDSCYRFFGGAKNFKAAGAKCQALNGSLVSIESAQENNFLSNVLSLTANKDEHEWYTAGRLSKKSWRWYRTVLRSSTKSQSKKKQRGRKRKGRKGKGRKRSRSRKVRSAKRRSRMRRMRSTVEATKWFPGWSHTGEGSEPSNKKGHTCLVLTDLFPLPNGTDINVDYFYWKVSRCRKRGATISFICEMPAQPQAKECITGIGEDYRGLVSRTDIGTSCMSWASTGVNENTHPRRGLGDHNYCRNPDGDHRPWCWVARGKFGFCPIPSCSATTPAPATTSTIAPGILNCPAQEFFCNSDNLCIPERFVCDGEEDCGDGMDEADCEYSSEKFEEYRDRIPEHQLNNLTYVNLPLETCATYCMGNTYFTCMSFVYNEDEKECQLLDASEDTRIHLLPSYNHDYYLLRTEAVNCTGKFRCDNDHCIPAEQMCNGHDDCGDASDEMSCATKPAAMTVRLEDGGENSGRVEVMYLGEWGTVCDDNWDINDAHVVCRMLGYPGAVRALGMGEFGTGRNNIVLDEVECVGNELTLQDCPASPWKNHDCQAFEAAGVECQIAKACEVDQFVCGQNVTSPLCVDPDKVCDEVPTCPDAADEQDCEVKIELKNGTTPREGRVEIVRNGIRGTVCDDEWGEEEARVVCNMLGYRYGGTALSESHFGRGSGLIWLDDVRCVGSERSLADCAHIGWTVNDCSHLEDASVRCFLTPPSVSTGSPDTTTTIPPESVHVYLANGSSPNQGRVQLEVGVHRGTICDDSFDDNDATVICRMAGYNDGGRAVLNAGYGPAPSHLPILLDEVECTGTEVSVLDCGHQDFGQHNCRHTEDAGVFCEVPGSSYRPDTDSLGRPVTTPGPQTTRKPPTSILDGTQCGLRPMERLLRHRRQAPEGSTNLTAPREVEVPRFSKIVGGDTAQHGMYPWQVGVNKIYNIYPNGEMLVSHWCGATILNRHWVVSAAHCFKNLPKSRVLLKVGDHGQKVVDEGEQKFQVEELILHRNYDQDTHDYDIALLKVKSEDGQGIKFNDYVQPACLPAEETAYVTGTRCHISGWGETGTDDNSNYPSNLRAAVVPLLPFATCNYLYKGDLTSRMLCAGYLNGGMDTCQGDSGGPLVCKVDDVYTIMGVTSWGFGCARPNAPGIYARTKEFRSWIEDTVHKFP